MTTKPIILGIKKLYRLSFYRPLKIFEQLIRTIVFLFLPQRWNGFQLFKLPTKSIFQEDTPVIAAVKQTRKLPYTIEPTIHERFQELSVSDRGAQFIKLKKGFATNSGAHLNRHGEMVKNYTEFFGPSHPLFRFRFSRMISPIKKFEAQVASLAADCQNNYYHWLFDVLPKLHILKEAKLEPTFYYADNSCLFQKDSLALLGIRDDQVISASEHPFIFAEELVVPSFPCMGPIPCWAIDFLKKNIGDKVRANSPKKIYISRSDAKNRRILNEQEIWPILEQEGFVKIVPGDYSLTEQVACFKEAEVIVAPHGAGLSNLAFCTKKVKLIEIFPQGIPCICFWSLSNLLGINYSFFRGESLPGDHQDAGYNNILVNPDKLKKSLNF